MSSDRRALQLTVPADAANQRLDAWLGTVSEIGSRNQAARLIEKNNVKISGVATLKVKASFRLRGGEDVHVDLEIPGSTSVIAQDIHLEILYEDESIIVVNKPAGMVTHPAAGNPDGTLVNALMYRFETLSEVGGAERPGLVHRIDKGTSGLLVVARSNKAHQKLAEMFKEHDIHRVYWALVGGVPTKATGRIESCLARHPVHRKAFCSQKTGKTAVTHYEVVEKFGRFASLLHVKLETGRTHQIRVHLSEMGHPVFGDTLYGIKRQKHYLKNKNVLEKAVASLGHQALHAAELGFRHPITNQPMQFKVDWPDDLRQLYRLLQESV